MAAPDERTTVEPQDYRTWYLICRTEDIGMDVTVPDGLVNVGLPRWRGGPAPHRPAIKGILKNHDGLASVGSGLGFLARSHSLIHQQNGAEGQGGYQVSFQV
jgi:hypothetical protein